ncbi:MAG TPA: MFS transporter [Amnibacterium sp.]|nr:MFS transporter [Amnibacterium sp.]
MQQAIAPGVAPAALHRVSHRTGFWLVAYSFTVVMGFSALPTPLYALYAAKDRFSSLVITLVFAVYVVGVIASLLLVGHVSDQYGRRRVLLPATAISALAGAVFIVSPTLPALITGRFLSGIAVGLMTTAATAHLGELHHQHRPDASPTRARLVAVAANLGGIGLGPLIAGVLAQFAPDPLQVPYLVEEALLTIAVVTLAVAPETVTPRSPSVPYRPQRLAVPRAARGRFALAALAGFVAFGVFGLFTSLAPGLLSRTLGQSSPALAGAVAFSVFAAAAIAQITSRSLEVRRSLAIGLVALVVGLAVLAVGTWTAGLAVFATGGVLTGAGAGLVFNGALVTTIDIAPPGSRAEVLAGFFVASYAGLAVPVVALGAIGPLVSAPVEVTGFGAVSIALLVPTVARLMVRPRGVVR